jgi:hypothetical protein
MVQKPLKKDLGIGVVHHDGDLTRHGPTWVGIPIAGNRTANAKAYLADAKEIKSGA